MFATGATTGNEFLYDDNGDGTATITDYMGSDSEVDIPDQLGGLYVTAIGDNAFRNKRLSNVTIPDTVEKIGDRAFASNQLTFVDIPDSVIEMEYRAFYQNQLIEVDLPNSLTTLKNGVFQYNLLESVTLPSSLLEIKTLAFNNNKLTHVNIPDGVESIDSRAFSSNLISSVQLPISLKSIESNGYFAFWDNPLESVEVDEDNLHFSDKNEKGLYNKEGNTILFGLPSGEIAPGTERIGQFAFADPNVSEITIPSSVTHIEAHAFDGSTLTAIDIPINVNQIELNAFQNGQLSEVIIRNDQVQITNHAFSGNQINSQDLTITGHAGSTAETYADNHNHTFRALQFETEDNANGVTIIDYIGNDTDVVIPEQIDSKDVTIIGPRAFEEKDLANVEIPDSVVEIGDYAFESNDLAEINLPEGLLELGTGAFYNNKLAGLILPESLIEIGRYAFAFNELVSIIIPESVEMIGERAFDDNNLSDVTILNPQVNLDSWIFSNNQFNSEDLMIHGFNDSTAEEYAQRYNYTFNLLDILIESVEILDDISIDYGTELVDIPLPEEVEVILSDGTTQKSSVTWDEGTPKYGAFIFGDYTFTGAIELSSDVINLNNIEASILVTVIDDFDIELDQEQYVAAGETYQLLGTKTVLTMAADLPVGTGLLVDAYNNSDQDGLLVAGDSLTFTFIYPVIEDLPEEDFVLIMGYDSGADQDSVDIYYLNETTGEWEARHGEVNEADHTIKVNVAEFSTYAVFEQLEIDEEDPGDEEEESPGDNEEESPDDDEGEATPLGEDEDEETLSDDEGGEAAGDEDEAAPDSDAEQTESDNLAELPQTSTTIFNTLIIGLIFMLIGASFYWFNRRKVSNLKN